MLRVYTSIWISWLLFAGALCEVDTNGCEEYPCQNGGVCESINGGYKCLCSQQSQHGHFYGGENCTVLLLGCEGNLCTNGGICSPLLMDDQHTYTCICLVGFSGQKCQTPTVFSFETSGYMYIETKLLDREAPLNVTLSFRTERPVGTLLRYAVDDLLLTIELTDDRLRLSRRLQGQGSRTLVQELPQNVTDHQWHTVEASLGGEASLVRLLHSPCSEGSCARETTTEGTVLEQGSSLPDRGSVHQSLVLGGVGMGWGSGGTGVEEADTHPSFLGCFRDVFVDSQLVVPHGRLANSPAQVNVTMGCSDRDKCEDSPCQTRGWCVSQGWRSYTCECYRPYEGPDCSEEYISARFGNGDLESYAVFSLEDDLWESVSVSMFVRTRRPNGLLLALANSTSRYLRVWLEEGRVKVQVNDLESLEGHVSISDGHFHLVTVRLEGNTLSLSQSAQSQGTVPIQPVLAQRGDLLYVGGLVDRRASASFGGYFRGCVQDLRVNNRRLQFYVMGVHVSSYTLEHLVNVTRGCTGDDGCSSNPCLNGGMCSSTWDDFTCNCPPNTAGRRCEEVKWCELSPCPSAAVCLSLPQGFECVSNVTIRGDRAILSYRGNGKISRSLSSVLLSVRTRQTDATLLHAERGSEYLTISLQESHLLLELQAGDGEEGSPKLTAQSRRPISDGEWHTVELYMAAPNLQTARWTMVLDKGREEKPSVSAISSGNLDFLRDGVDILLGGSGPDTGENLAGCLGPVEIGGVPLPYYGDADLNLPRPQDEQFVRIASTEVPRYGCWGASVCVPNSCLNQGVCEDIFDQSLCRCFSGWAGPQCQDSMDTCASGPCVHGNCSVLAGGYKCVCEPGYTGARCEAETDVCEDNRCGQGATCLGGFQTYTCLCPEKTSGPRCTEKAPEMSWHTDKIDLPNLPVSLCLGVVWNYRCFNGGNCSSVENTCDCLPGFVGQWCQTDVDECWSDPCENGGTCRNLVPGFQCVCDTTFAGIHCQIDVNDIYLYIFMFLWQNIFQLMSYLILRLDVLPEVDWEMIDDDDDERIIEMIDDDDDDDDEDEIIDERRDE